jgi:phosphoglycolate phosphatase
MYNLVICDLDGTLADSAPGIVASFNASLEFFGIAPQPAASVVPLIGLPLHVMYERFLAPAQLPLVPDMIDAYRRVYAAEAIPATHLFPGVEATLRELRERGLTLSIASSKIVPVSRSLLAHCGIADLFDLIAGGDSVERSKPDPEMLHYSLARLGRAPADALMVGDSVHDVAMARAAGVACCAVTYGVSSAEELRAAGADWLVDSFAAVARIVADLN